MKSENSRGLLNPSQKSLDFMLSNCCHVLKNLFHLNSSLDEGEIAPFRGVCEIKVVTDLEQWRGQSLSTCCIN